MNEQSSRSHAIFTVFLEQVIALDSCLLLSLTMALTLQRKKAGTAAAKRLGAGTAGGEEKKEGTALIQRAALPTLFRFAQT
jgi:hypothetical protein